MSGFLVLAGLSFFKRAMVSAYLFPSLSPLWDTEIVSEWEGNVPLGNSVMY